jgi:hypothetical protein
VETKKYECTGELKTEIHIFSKGGNSRMAAHRLINFRKVKDHGRIYRFYQNHYFVDEAFKYGDDTTI